jgi:excinuclease ABC subunit A
VLRISGARAHNLKNIDVEIPLGMMVAVTGVSGSGKSTLVHDVLFRRSKRCTNRGTRRRSGCRRRTRKWRSAPRLACRKVEGAERIASTVMIDQSPIGRTPRSNPVTYIKAFDMIRALFASTREAEKRGYTPGHFSFNMPGGRCETCQGDGTVTVEMQFLADVELICEECKGTRYKSGILEIRYNGLNIHEVLQLTVREAMDVLPRHAAAGAQAEGAGRRGAGLSAAGPIRHHAFRRRGAAREAGAHLAMASCEGTLFIFDEPTTGLHFDDIAKLLAAFRALIENGGSLIVIEHNLDVIKAADWVIDLGPEGGARGGYVVVAGTPETAGCGAGWYPAAEWHSACRPVCKCRPGRVPLGRRLPTCPTRRGPNTARERCCTSPAGLPITPDLPTSMCSWRTRSKPSIPRACR